MLTTYTDTVHRDLVQYSQDFFNVWSLLRFSKDVYNGVLRRKRNPTPYDNELDEASIYGAHPTKSGPFEPTLNHRMGSAPLYGRKDQYGEQEDKLKSLLEMFLSGMPGNFGSDLYNHMGFHKDGGGSPDRNVKEMDFPTFISAWRSALFVIYKDMDNISPMVRALAAVGRGTYTSSANASSFKHKKTTTVNEVEQHEDQQTLVCEVCAVIDPKEAKEKSPISKADFCLSLLLGNNCLQGDQCKRKHSKEAFAEFAKEVRKFGETNMNWAPSKQPGKVLVARSGAKYTPKIIQRPQVTNLGSRNIHEVTEQGEFEEDDEEENMLDWHMDQVNAVHFEHDN
jgi:hypothetical protein